MYVEGATLAHRLAASRDYKHSVTQPDLHFLEASALTSCICRPPETNGLIIFGLRQINLYRDPSDFHWEHIILLRKEGGASLMGGLQITQSLGRLQTAAAISIPDFLICSPFCKATVVFFRKRNLQPIQHRDVQYPAYANRRQGPWVIGWAFLLGSAAYAWAHKECGSSRLAS